MTLKYEIAVTPVLTDTIRKFCQSINNEIPFFVDVKVAPTAQLLDCFNNVQAYITENGGEMINGWAIWEQPNLFVEAEFHAIWYKDGQYLDITPKDNPTTRILFLPDKNKKYEGQYISNIREVFFNLNELKEFFELVDKQFMLLNQNSLPDTNQIDLSPILQELGQISRRQLELKSIIDKYHIQVSPYLPCPCGCGKKTKWCDFKQK